MNNNEILWVVLLSLSTSPCLAVNKCVERSGRIFYQDAPCPTDTYGGEMSLNVNRSFTGQAASPVLIERAVSSNHSADLTNTTATDEGAIPPLDTAEKPETANVEQDTDSMQDVKESDVAIEDETEATPPSAKKLNIDSKPKPKKPSPKIIDNSEVVDQDSMESSLSRLETTQHESSR